MQFLGRVDVAVMSSLIDCYTVTFMSTEYLLVSGSHYVHYFSGNLFHCVHVYSCRLQNFSTPLEKCVEHS